MHDAGSDGENTPNWKSKPIITAITRMAHP
jgi:hypothetical protein